MSSPTTSNRESWDAVDVVKFTCNVPEDVLGLVAEANGQNRITKKDPALIIEINDQALNLRQPAFAGINVSKAAIAAIVTAQGMTEVADIVNQPSRLIYRGTLQQMFRALNDLAWTQWTRPAAGLPDVGKLWVAMSTADVHALASPFNS